MEVFDFHVDWNNPGLDLHAERDAADDVRREHVQRAEPVQQLRSSAGHGDLLETLTNWSMQPLQYRNFGTRDTLVFTHSVDENGSDHAGVRWYELWRATPGMGAWTMFQGATHAPMQSTAGWGALP